jgi:hypothetical protein
MVESMARGSHAAWSRDGFWHPCSDRRADDGPYGIT